MSDIQPHAVKATMLRESLVSAKTWDIYSPPPGNTLKGSLIPKVVTKLNPNRRRRISVEVHRMYTSHTEEQDDFLEGLAPLETENPQGGSSSEGNQKSKRFAIPSNKGQNDFYEQCVVRLLTPENSTVTRQSRQAAKKKKIQNRNDYLTSISDDVTSLRGGPDDDDNTVGGEAFADRDDISNLPSYKGWNAKYKLPIISMSIKSVHKNDVMITTEIRHIKHTRNLIFDSEHEAMEFVQMIEVQKEAEHERSRIKLQHALGGLKIISGEEVTLLVEIVSASDVPIADLKSSDPFVICSINDREVHRTDFISKNLNPVWTINTGSLFLLTLPTKELFMSDGLLCEVADFDTLGNNETLGAVHIPPKTLYEAKGQRMTFKLKKLPHGQVDNAKCSLSVRVRHATTNDKKFMRELKESNIRKVKTTKIPANAGGKGELRSIVERVRKTERQHDGSLIKKYRTRPSPDPKRKSETEWLTKQHIETEMLKNSTEWLDTGSGNVARIFVEILCCDGLPNLDSGGFLGNKTDAFVALVHEDTWAQTDVIDDCLNPRWLPWSRRAFIFHQAHSSSQLFLGVFDHDTGLDDHDLIGRVSVDMSNLRPNTVYTLTYNIFPSARMTERKSQGTVTLRLRMEVDDETKLLTCCIEPPRTQYVNVKKRKEFRVIQYTCTGRYNMDDYSMKVITSYIDELSTYQNILLDLQDAAISLLFWRGQFDVEINDKIYRLPVHSITAFLAFVILVERPTYIPSFFFASISWVMIATMFHRRHHPDPWRKCKSFFELLLTIALGSSQCGPHIIQVNQNKDESVAFEEQIRKRIVEAERLSLKAAKEAEEEQAQVERDLQEIGKTDNDISTKKARGISIDPFRRIMEPIQGYLQLACRIIRYIRNIVLWEECYLAFWITSGCFILSITCLFVPWAFLILWTSRIIVWTIFGPWMRLVDLFYYSKIENMTEEEIEKQKEKFMKARHLRIKAMALKAKIDRENAQKQKDIKQFMFGKYIVKVPVLKEDRWRDFPLPQSSAEPYKPKPLALAELAMQEAGYHRTRVPGQHLEGDMIPTIQTKAFTEAPVGQATKLHAENESTTVAYASIGSVIAGAAVITYFGVPVVGSLAHATFGG